MLSVKDFEDYLHSKGGLENGYNGNPIMTREFFEVDDGWLKLIKDCIEECLTFGWDKKVYQVKEKFNCLRFYIKLPNTEIEKVVKKYEKLSCSICCKCGAIECICDT